MLTDIRATAGDVYGYDVAISGRIAVVSNPHGGSQRSGEVDLYRRVSADKWVRIKQFKAPNRGNDLFGRSFRSKAGRGDFDACRH